MLEYEWGNPSTIMFNPDENPPENDQNRQFLDPYTSHGFHEPPGSIAFINTNAQYGPTTHHHTPQPFPGGGHHFNQSIYDPLASYGESSYTHHATQTSFLSIEPDGSTSYMVVPKSEPLVSGIDFGNAGRIGLNLGGRTYFASSEDDFVSRLYRRSRVVEPGSVNAPRCQAEGCNADLSNAKHYHRRHKVCEYHSKAATVITAGLTQRFCQQCSRFHLLSEFDNGKRSCRKRLADHNRRRRKSQQRSSPSQENPNKSLREHAPNSPPSNTARSPPASGAQSSSVTVAVSPPRMSLDGFRQRSYQVGTSSSASTSSVFYSNG